MDRISTRQYKNLNPTAKKVLNDAQSDFNRKYQTLRATEKAFKIEYPQFFDKFDSLVAESCLKATDDEIKKLYDAIIKYCEASNEYNDSVYYLNDVIDALSEE